MLNMLRPRGLSLHLFVYIFILRWHFFFFDSCGLQHTLKYARPQLAFIIQRDPSGLSSIQSPNIYVTSDPNSPTSRTLRALKTHFYIGTTVPTDVCEPLKPFAAQPHGSTALQSFSLCQHFGPSVSLKGIRVVMPDKISYKQMIFIYQLLQQIFI